MKNFLILTLLLSFSSCAGFLRTTHEYCTDYWQRYGSYDRCYAEKSAERRQNAEDIRQSQANYSANMQALTYQSMQRRREVKCESNQYGNTVYTNCR